MPRDIPKYSNVEEHDGKYYKVTKKQLHPKVPAVKVRRQIVFSEDIADFLADYYSHEDYAGALLGRDKLYPAIRDKFAGISKSAVEKFLANSETNQIHKVAPRVAASRPVVPTRPNARWCVDLVNIANADDRVLFVLLTCVDSFSKFASARIVSDKTAASAARAMKSIIAGAGMAPSVLASDRGGEFTGKEFQGLLRQYGVKHLVSEAYSPTQNAVVERFNRTLKSMVNKWLTHVNGVVIDDSTLQKLISNYNNTVHASTKRKPIDVAGNMFVGEVYARLARRARRIVEDSEHTYPRLRVGDMVRVHRRTGSEWRAKTQFKKYGYRRQWSVELFKVAEFTRKYAGKAALYTLYDVAPGSLVSRRFLRSDLSRVDEAELIREMPEGTFAVEAVLDKKLARGVPRYLIKWKGYDETTWEAVQPSYQRLIDEYNGGSSERERAKNK